MEGCISPSVTKCLYTSSANIYISCLAARAIIVSNSSLLNKVPVGLQGVEKQIILVLGVMSRSNSFISI